MGVTVAIFGIIRLFKEDDSRDHAVTRSTRHAAKRQSNQLIKQRGTVAV